MKDTKIVPGGTRNLVIKIIAQQIILRNAILIHEIEYFKKIFFMANVSSLNQKYPQSN